MRIPKSLQTLTATHITLREFLFFVLPPTHPQIPPSSTGVRTLLDAIVVCLRHATPSTTEAWHKVIFRAYNPNFEYATDHTELINKQIASVMKREQAQQIKWNQSNLLTRGYQTRGREHDVGMLNNENMIQRQTNSMVNQLMARPWQVLHEWCGDEIIIFLLSKTLMFEEITNGCWVQLTGPPLCSLIGKSQQHSYRAPIVPARSALLRKQPTTTKQHIVVQDQVLLRRSRMFYVRSQPTSSGLRERHFVNTNNTTCEIASKTTARNLALDILYPREQAVKPRRNARRDGVSTTTATTTADPRPRQ